MSEGVSFVFPFVDCSDPMWREEYRKFFPQETPSPERFRDLGLLRYVFRGLAECMPWLDEVVFLVQGMSQVPKWLQGVRVVTHEEFIPKKYLPVFNSNAIEMFLSDIPGLKERVIYSNDDFLPIGPLTQEDYFSRDGLPRISWAKHPAPNTSFRRNCQRNWQVANKVVGKETRGTEYIRPCHEPQPITRSQLRRAARVTTVDRMKSISRKRKLSTDLSQYLFFDYLIALGEYEKREKYDLYSSITRAALPKIESAIKGQECKWLILNDTGKTDLSVVPRILSLFHEEYPKKSKYEK